MNKFFKLKEHNTTVRRETIAALTSFFAAVYIIIVNASILSDSGIAIEPLIISTVLSSLLGCILVGFISNAPLIIMPGMGINALFTYTIVKTLGLTFYEGLATVVIAGILFVIIALTPLAKIITEAIPSNFKAAITVGIGLFITLIGLGKSGLVVSDPSTLLKLGNITSPEVIAFIIIMIITLILFIKNVPGGFLISIILGTIISIFMGIVDVSNLTFSLPDFNAYKDIFFNADFGGMTNPNFWIATFSLTLVLVFENIGLLHGQLTGMLNVPEKAPKALSAIAFSVIGYGFLGSSPPVSTVEGAAGIAAGGRTGLTSIITGLLFLASIFFIPFISIIPNAALSPILIIIGSLMFQNLKYIDFDDLTELFPAFIIIILIPLTYSIVDGIAFGFILYPICKLFTNKKKDVSITMYITSLIFLIYFIVQGFIH
ncbi:NCS2 family permease [Clostridium uliginosum]|nr:NCS2 family permease [Clostridium uliginosum]